MTALLFAARHTASELRAIAAELAAPEADPLAVARRLAALAGGLEADIARAVSAAAYAEGRPSGATPALVGVDRLYAREQGAH